MLTIWDAFLRRMAETPAAPAVTGPRRATYADIARSVDAVAEEIGRSCPPGSMIALDALGGLQAAVALLSVARAGCVALPLNPESPAVHRSRVLGDARPAAVLTGAVGDGLVLTQGAGEPARYPQELAYVMYTSGSTGRPKGVMVSHRALLGRLRATARMPGFSRGESILAATPLSFDPALLEVVMPLVIGGSLIELPTEARLDPAEFVSFLAASGPNVVQATPSFWRLLLAGGDPGLPPHCRVWCGGEPMTPDLARSLLPRCRELWNVYGPTEALIWATAGRISSPGSISVGRPLPGVELQLDQGEIVIWGDLADGYLNAPDLTAERFPVAGARRGYRTGDRGRWSEDGSLIFLGRADSQVKLRGNRIELGEVEAVIEAHPSVREAVALVADADRPDHATIVAHVVADGGLAAEDIDDWIRARLPRSYCPSQVDFHSELPRTTSGKVDRVLLAQIGKRQGSRTA